MFLLTALWLVVAPQSLPYVDEQCAASFACNETIIYELMYGGIVLPTLEGDLTKEECEQLKADIQEATKAMSELTCRPRLVEREDS